MLTPRTSVSKVVLAFEKAFGSARVQKIPCDGSIQLEDNSEKLKPADASSSIIGLCLYVVIFESSCRNRKIFGISPSLRKTKHDRSG